MRIKKIIIGISSIIVLGIVICLIVLLYNVSHINSGKYHLEKVEFDSYTELKNNFEKFNSVNNEGDFNIFPLDDLPLQNIGYGIEGIRDNDKLVEQMTDKYPFVYGENSLGYPIAVGYRHQIENINTNGMEWKPEADIKGSQSIIACRSYLKESFSISYSYPLLDGNGELILVLTIYLQEDMVKKGFYSTETIPEEAKEVTDFLLNKFLNQEI